MVDRTEGSTPCLCGDPVNTDQARSRGVGPTDRPDAVKRRRARVEETSGSDDADIFRVTYLPEAQWMFP
ncbi:hypothetical protein GCM10010340_43110 [Streptomyces griseoloalbus]|nr:hypothetical protein GCM10010294_21760 [Streptomyces griseoloalbus]GGW60093.1 hypothetical protein GCM10010340_43110 [Streptomyces albaduncus]